jgi:hypothetical protein
MRSTARAGSIALLAAFFAALIATSCLPQVATPDAAPRTAAFWYLWYPQTTTGHYTPSTQPYSSDDPALLKTEIDQMQGAGIQVGIISWFGAGTESEATRIPAALSAAQGTNFRETLYYEPEGIGDPSSATIDSDLTYIDQHYSSASTYLRVNGKPVLFVYADANDGCGMADRWAQAPESQKFYVVLKVFSGFAACAHQPDDWHQYGPASATSDQGAYSYSVSPGFWKGTETTPRLPRDLTRWRTDLEAMKASPARWHLITTFNEMGEGTGIEPTTEYGTAYLDTVRDVLLGSGSPATTAPATTAPATTAAPTTAPPTTLPTSTGVCATTSSHPAISHVVVFSNENKTWSDVGGTQFQSMPYLNSLAKQCRTYANWTETDTSQNSASQYVGATTGVKQASGTDNNVLSDCNPDITSCRSLTDNIFRQVRASGGTVRSYVEGATTGCSASGNAAKHVPALYMMGGSDQSYCSTEVRPLSEFDPNALPTFSFITPTLCNDMHDCGVSTGDAWLKAQLQPVLDSAAYKSGSVLVEVWFDEDHPVPNMLLNPAIPAGVDTTTAATHFGALRLWEDLLGLPHLPDAAGAVDLRPSLNLQ